MDPTEPLTPHHPRWRVERRIVRLIDSQYGPNWGPAHHRLAQRMLGLWKSGQLHELQLQDWIEGKIQLR